MLFHTYYFRCQIIWKFCTQHNSVPCKTFHNGVPATIDIIERLIFSNTATPQFALEGQISVCYVCSETDLFALFVTVTLYPYRVIFYRFITGQVCVIKLDLLYMSHFWKRLCNVGLSNSKPVHHFKQSTWSTLLLNLNSPWQPVTIETT